ncbi:nuclear RNA export factor 1-like isoform X2 [Hyperolius riggenbachi]|uniref:nuclear RNA export factor 1-like isoform X2 n=2 Tax=Hyperolius riggenbachi TaxID=752182 RepID=UPI0035A38049
MRKEITVRLLESTLQAASGHLLRGNYNAQHARLSILVGGEAEQCNSNQISPPPPSTAQIRGNCTSSCRFEVKMESSTFCHLRNYSQKARYKVTSRLENQNNQQRPKRQNYFKISIPYGRYYNQTWLLNSIVNQCGQHFRVYQYKYQSNSASFFVNSFYVSQRLLQVSRKIQGQNNHKISIHVVPFHLTPDQISAMDYVNTWELSPLNSLKLLDNGSQHIQKCLQRRYQHRGECLDLSSLSSDSELLSANIYMFLNNPLLVSIILQVIAQNFPQLWRLDLSHNQLSDLCEFMHLFNITPQLRALSLAHNNLRHIQQLKHINNLNLTELWLQGNPLDQSMMSRPEYYRIVNDHFPAIQQLDGHLLRGNVFYEPVKIQPLPLAKGSFFPNEDIRNSLSDFLFQYYTLYDSDNRQSLLPLYHEHCYFSLSIPSVSFTKLCYEQIRDYQKFNRNLKAKKGAQRQSLIKHNQLEVVGFLCNLPKTEHDLQSVTVDVCYQNASVLCFSVEGRFRPVEKSKSGFIPFRRTFIIVPSPGTGAQIVNDQMVFTNAYCGIPDVLSGGPSCSTLFDQTKAGDAGNLNIQGPQAASDQMDINSPFSGLQDASPQCHPNSALFSGGQLVACGNRGYKIQRPQAVSDQMDINSQYAGLQGKSSQCHPNSALLSCGQTVACDNRDSKIQSGQMMNSQIFVTVQNARQPGTSAEISSSSMLSICEQLASGDQRVRALITVSQYTRTEPSLAKQCLEKNNWDVEKAISDFFSYQNTVPAVANRDDLTIKQEP